MTEVHEAPVADFVRVMTCFQQADYPHQYVRIHTATNSSLEAETISAVTDLSLVFTFVRPTKEKIRKIPFILECAFTQPHNKVFDKVEELITTCPEASMVVVILIKKAAAYTSPVEGSPAWECFKQDEVAKSLKGFMSVCNLEPEVQDVVEEFMILVAASGHMWCSINEVKYYVWLRQSTGDNPAERIKIDAQNVHQTEWSAHGVRFIPVYRTAESS